MRCSFDGLSVRVSTHPGQNPANGKCFAFFNWRRTIVKVVGFKHGRLFIWSKRLERGLLAPVPGRGHAALSLSKIELSALLEGIDITVRRHRKRCSPAMEVAVGR